MCLMYEVMFHVLRLSPCRSSSAPGLHVVFALPCLSLSCPSHGRVAVLLVQSYVWPVQSSSKRSASLPSLSGFVPLALRYQCWYSTAGASLARKWLMLNFRPCSRKHPFHQLYQLQHNILNSIGQGLLLAGPSPPWTLWRIQSVFVFFVF